MSSFGGEGFWILLVVEELAGDICGYGCQNLPAGNLHHFDIVGPKALVDRSDGAHAPRRHGLLAPERLSEHMTAPSISAHTGCIDAMRIDPNRRGRIIGGRLNVRNIWLRV